MQTNPLLESIRRDPNVSQAFRDALPTAPALTPLELAWANLCRTLHANQPRDLRNYNSRAALTGRAIDIEAHILAFQTWLTALVEDTSQHVNINCAELVRTVEARMRDMAGDIRGSLVDQIHKDAAA
jgi:hypothetical protein